MTDRRRQRRRPRHTWLVLVIALLVLAGAVVAGAALLLAGDDSASSTGRCAGAKYALSAARDDDDRASARIRIVTSRPAQEWAVRIAVGTGDARRTVLDRSVTSDENAKIRLDAPLDDVGGTVAVSATIERPDKDACTIRLSLP